ncbi:DnaJ family C protein (macronuclear) [Tetrahymena thermophila SB210]|uniref:DnaJ family C protein n=1 Tax=Tetrahymena thermophila (strain SB210) TaxID=312017 RepID=A4VF46_TETTS|nr:DnaJ family C protein [Tetrahymena thermophila SB210]EDK31255.2 DnaJ family C protein [Tetrahymena thermophila SB210]|eukprot:XP_001471507.2 DnaJ family C protein [Tetrahymena thermophila SB210]
MKTLFLVIISAIQIQLVISGVANVYCGDKNCYDILGISSSATPEEIRVAFRKQSKEFHPDRNLHKGIDTHAQYQLITKAYEVLKDENVRQSYDSYLANPSKGEYYHYYNYYKAVYAPQTNPFVVIICTLLFLSFFQYLARNNAYETAIRSVQKTDKFKQDVNNLHREQPERKKEEIKQELLQRIVIQGGQSKIKIQEILIIRVTLLPYFICKYLYKKIRWVVRYNIQKKEYTREDQEILTMQLLKIKDYRWEGLNEEDKEELLEKKLWIKENYAQYVKEQTEAYEKRKEEFLNSNKGKKYLRYMKGGK